MPQAKVGPLTIEYEIFGRKTDPAVLLIMGFSAQLTMWPVAFCEGIARRGFRVIRFDNRDIGLSTHLSGQPAPNPFELMGKVIAGETVDVPYHLEDMAADAVGLLDALHIKSAHIVGASMGGMIAQIVAAKYPVRTRSLVSIMSTSGNRSLPQAKPEAMAALTTPPVSDRREDRIAQGFKIWRAIGSPGFPVPEAELREFVEGLIDRAPYDPAGVARQMAAVVAAPPRNDLLKTIRVPSLVFHGEADPLLPVECGRDTAASIPGCKLVTVPGMGHDISNALVPIYIETVGDFVESVEARAKAAE